jgi:hypothetical protein
MGFSTPWPSKDKCDAALSKNHPNTMIAAVARDSEWKFLGASLVVLQGIS